MQFDDLIATLNQLNIQISLKNDDQLAINADKGVITPELMQALKAHKSRLIALAKSQQSQIQGITPREDKTQAPLSSSQQRLWFVEQLAPGAATYHVPLAVRIRGRLDKSYLQQSIKCLIDRHEALRTAFTQIDGVPRQLIEPEVSFHLEEQACLFDADSEATISLVQSLITQSFDLAKAPLMHATLLSFKHPHEYILLINCHHLITDGWSNQILLKELAYHYLTLDKGETPALPPIKVQYPDYAQWQQAKNNLDASLNFWKQQLEGSETLNLPFDYPRPATKSGQGALFSFDLPDELSIGLSDLISQANCTPFTFYLAVFAGFLQKITNQTDIVIGTPHANRELSDIQQTVGFFVNTLALRLSVDPNQNLLEQIDQARTLMLKVSEHQDVPFETILDALSIERDRSVTPVFQVMMVYQKEAIQTSQEALNIQPLGIETHTAKFDLTLGISESVNGVKLSFEYDTDLFDPSTIARWAKHFIHLLTQTIQSPSQPFGAMSLLSAADQDDIKAIAPPNQWIDAGSTLQQRWQSIVSEYADNQAFRFDDQTFTYREFDSWTNQIAQTLIAKGAQPKQAVVICLERRIEMLGLIIGSLKVGSFYIPIDPAYPSARQQHILDSAEPCLLITDSAIESNIQQVSVADFFEQVTDAPTKFSIHDGDLNDDAYWIYTSGSTGIPKGVPITQNNLCRLIDDKENFYINQHSRIAHISNVAFDASIWEIFCSLFNGATLIGFSKDQVLDTHLFAERMKHEEVTHALMTVALFNVIADLEPAAFSDLDWLGIGGEAPNIDKVRKVFEHGKPKHLFNAYGPAENTVLTSLHDIHIDDCQRSAIPLGQPVANTFCYVIDENGHLCPFGVTGELAVSGSGLSRGYHALPKENAKAFITNPFISKQDPNETLYRTGDMAVRYANGALVLKGRQDDQIKIRGFRIELEEITQALTQLSFVQDATVVYRKGDSNDNAYLAAFVVPDKNTQTNNLPARIAGDLALTLPHYMIPSAFGLIERIPLTANGKVDKRQLQGAVSINDGIYQAPETEMEKQVAEVFGDLLQVDEVSRDADFFHLGGQSLLATRVIASLRQNTELDIQLQHLFDYPKVDVLARFLEQLAQEGRTVQLDQIERPEKLPLSFAQQRLWFIEQMQPGSLYHMPFALKVSGQLDTIALNAAFTTVILRHESLRTRFVVDKTDKTPHQIIDDKPNFDLPVLPFMGNESDLLIAVSDFIETPFDLSTDALIRGQLLHRQTDDQYFLMLCLHHIIADGWSIEILIRDLWVSYQEILGKGLHNLPPLPLQYADFTLLQTANTNTQKDLDYWLEHLADIQPLALPTDFPRPAILDNQGGEVRFTLTESLSRKLHAFCKEQNVSLFMLMHSALSVLLARYSRETDISIGTPIANRSEYQVEDVIGLFLNTIVLRQSIDLADDFKTLLEASKATTLLGFEHQNTPFDQVIDQLNLPRDLSQTPLFSVMLIVQTAASLANQQFLQGDLGDIQLSSIEGSERLQSAKFDLTFNVIDLEGAIEIALEYRTSLYKDSTIERMGKHLSRLLDRLVDEPELALAKQSFLLDDELHFLLEAGPNQTQVNYPKASSIHELFEAQVLRTPNRIAVSDESSSLTYKALDEEANQLANLLIADKQPAIGLSLYRSRLMLVGILGILKSGKAYVPIDPELPNERIRFILDDANITTVVSDTQTRFTTDCKALFIDQIPEATANHKPDVKISDQDLVNILFTSGSTGKPKGVMVPHKGIINRLQWMQDQYPIGPIDKVLQKTPFTFDVSVWEFLWPVMTGAELVFAKKDGHKDPAYLAELIQSAGITTLHFVPSMMRAFLSQRESQSHLPELTSIKQVFTSGEALPPDVACDWLAHFPHSSLDNLYGPTEASIDVSFYPVRDKNATQISIGKPIANTQLLILDEAMNLCPLGVPGEITIGGANLAQGYLNRDDLTQKAFVDNPFPAIPSSKLYKTGDLGLMREDGNIRYLGRNDFQVKLRGQRIELGEIENQLNQLEGVNQSVVIKTTVENEEALVAYYSGEQWDAADCYKALSAHLPIYMLPNYFQHLTAIPLNLNGKVDRKALPSIQRKTDENPSSNPATTALEKQLAQLFGDVLKIEEPLLQIGKDDNFFLIGGHSLRAIALVGLIDEKIGITLPVTDIFVHPTLAGLATHIEQQATDPSLDLPEIEKHPIGDALVQASQNQYRMWRYQSTHKGSTAYHMPLAFWVEGDIDPNRVQSSLESLADRHPILKTQLIEQDGELFQTISETIEMPFELANAQTKDDALAIALGAFGKPFDLHKPCAFRAGFIQTQSSHLLYLVMHHVISDARSLEILLGDWLHLLTADREKLPELLPPIAFDYQDFSYWQNANQAALQTQLSFWQKHLDGAEDRLSVLSRLTGGHVAKNKRADTIKKTLGKAQVEAIQTAANWQSVTPFMLLLGALNLTLSKAGGQDQLTIGLPVSGRHRKGLNDIVGYFVNTLLFPVNINQSQNKREYLQQIKTQVLSTFANQDIALESILSSIDQPTFMPKVGFNYYTQDQSLPDSLSLDGLTFTAVDVPAQESKYDLIFSVLANSDAMTLTVEYPANRYDFDKINQLVDCFIYVTEQMTLAEDKPLADMQLYRPSDWLETHQLSKDDVAQTLPLTPMQRDIFLDSQLNPENPRNTLGWILHIDANTSLDFDAIHQAVAACIQQNAALRMRILTNQSLFGDAAFQVILTAKAAIEKSPLIEVELEDASDDALITYCQDQVYSSYEESEPLFGIYWIKRETASDAILIKGHHAAIDGLSLDIISRQLIDFYQAYQTDTLGEYEFDEDNYSAFVLSAQGFDHQDKQKQLAAIVTDCQPLSPPLGVSGQGFSTLTIDDTDAHFDAIKIWCKTNKTSPALYLKALYGCLLSAYCQPDTDFYIDEVLASRPAGHAGTLGAYFSTLPVRFIEAHFREGQFTDVLKALREQQKTSRNYQGMSHSAQQQFIPQGNVQFLYNFYTLPSHIPLNENECPLTFIPPVMDNAVNLTLQVVDQHLRLHLTYDNSQFTGNDFIFRLLSLSQQVLSGINQCRYLSILLPEEKVTLPQPCALPASSVIESLNHSFTQFRDQVAVIDTQGQHTYDDLDKASNRIANALLKEGIIPIDRIGLHLDASFDYLASLFGVLKTGATYVAIDTKYPAERKHFIGDDANLRLVLTAPNHAFDQPTLNPGILIAQGDATAVSLPQIEADHPIYVIYTSGSTGLPKGASVTQANFLNLLLWYQDSFTINSSQKVLIISSIGFDLTQKNLFAPLLGGATIVFQDQSVYDPQAIIQTIKNENISLVNAAPSACYLWLENAADFEKLKSLKWLLLGGEAIQSQLLNPWFTNPHNQAALVNMYGPSECTDIALSHTVTNGEPLADKLPLGRVSKGVATYFIDRAGRLLPKGFSGELAIAGAGVGLGYIGHAKNQNAAFIDHPQAGKLYRTGDFAVDATIDNTTGLYFLGRKDHQLKIRGQRIEAAEITYQINQLEGVKDSVVMLNDNEQLIAYLLTDTPISHLRELLQDKLPDAFIPTAFECLNSFPLSSNGKVDRSQLPPITISKTLVAPKTATEKLLLALWQGVFNEQAISTTDSFFALGGHSLLAATLVNQIQQQLGKSVALDTFLRHQTIEALGKVLDDTQQGASWNLTPVDRHGSFNDKGYPLSLGQERLWLLEQIQGRTSMYNMPMAFKLKGKINPLRLEDAIKQVAGHHQSLITRLRIKDGKARQFIDPSIPLLQVVEPSDVLSLEQQIFSLSQTPFDVNKDPLFKSLLLPTKEDEAALLFIAHHLISDGPSMTIFTQDLARVLIEGKLADETPPLQYIDFSSHQREHLSNDSIESQINYWKKQLKQVPLTQLPTDKAYPARADFRGSIHSFDIKGATAKKLEAFAQSQDATLSMLLMGALQLLLARYSGQTDITLGTAVNNRPDPKLENMMGFFVNTQAIRNQLNLSESFTSHLSAVKAAQLDAFANQDVPFEQLLEHLALPKSTGHSPVFQVFYNFQTHRDSLPSLDLADFSIHPFALSETQMHVTAKFELSLHMLHINNGDQVELSGSFEYRSQLFEKEAIEKLAANFSVLLDSLADLPDSPMSALPILSNSAIAKQSIKPAPMSADSFLPVIWQGEQDSLPDAIAIKDDHSSLSYLTLKQRIDHAAAILESEGVKHGDRVALMLAPSVDFMVTLLAIIQQGGCYIPIDIHLPEGRIQTILDAADCHWVIANKSTPNVPADKMISLQELKGTERTPRTNLELNLNDSLYMIFTSGSTGIPKGVEVLHQGENNLLAWYANEFDFKETAPQCLILSSLGFDLTQKNFFAPLMKGGTVHLMNQGFDPVDAAKRIEQDKITIINCAPSALYALLEVTQSELYNPLASLRWILLGGEPIQIERIQAFFEAHPHCQLVNMYGPTEATDISTCYHLAPHEFKQNPPIGLAIPGVVTYVLDEHRRFLPEGAIGELYIGGSNLAKGYYGQDQQTLEQFIWHDDLEQRLYRTGDLVRLRSDGNLFFEGRADHQVKIRGFRIELGEITHQLQSIAGVHQAVVLDRISPNTHQTCLIAYVAVDSDLESKALNVALARLLPDYMIPEKIVMLSSLPLNANGKIDRQALPEPEWTVERKDLVLPHNDDQTHLLAIWQQVLGTENISIDDSFFAIGGHSLKGAQLLGRIRDHFGIDINLQEIFTNDSIEKQSLLIEQKQLQPVVIPPLTKAPADSPKVLSYAQQRLWLLTQVSGQNPAYNMPAAWHIEGDLKVQALSLAINALVERHESLRLVFTANGGEPQVALLPAKESPIQLVTFDVPDKDAAEKLVTISLSEGFDLASGQLMRAELYRIGDQSHVLAMNMHHIISDGHSIQVLIKELMTFYHGFATNQMVDIAPLPLQYTDYAYWQRDWLQGDVLEKEIVWWKDTLKGVTEILPMPLDHPRPKVQSFEGSSFRMVLSERLTKKIASTSLDQNVTPFMLMLAAFHTLLHKFAQHDDIAVGVPLAGRSIEGLENQIGFFINAVVIRANCGANYRLDEFLQLIKTQVLNAFAHEYVPIEMLLNELGIERHLGVTPVVQCAFNMMVAEDSPQKNQSFESLTISPLHQESTVAKFDLQLNALQEKDQIILSLDYNTAIFEQSTVVQLMEAYSVLLEYFCLQPATTFERIELKSSDKNHWLPLTPMQRDIYLSAITRTDTLENSLGYAMHLPIAVEVDTFKECIIEIHRHFVALNTKVVKSEGLFEEMAYLAFDLDNPIDYTFVDCRLENLSAEQIDDKLKTTVMRPYELESSLVQYRLYQFADNEFWFTFANHHLISDGFSAVVHIQHLTHLYEQNLGGLSTLITTKDHFIDYIAESRTEFDRPDTLAFWQEQLKECQPLQTFLANQPAPEDKLLTRPVPVEHYHQIKTFCRKNKITPALYFKSLYALLISWYTRAEGDFVLTEFNGGRDKFTKDTMGCFYHTQPSLIPLDALQGSLGDLFGALRKLQKLTKNYLKISPRLLKKCLPDSEIGFSYNYLMLPHHYPMLGQSVTGNRYTPNAVGMVDFRVQADGDDVHLWLAFNAAYFDDNRFLDRLLALSDQCIQHVNHSQLFDYRLPDEIQPPLALEQSKLEQSKLEQLAPEQKTSPSVIQCLEEQATIHAQHLAVWDINKALTYDQFNQHVNQVAHALIRQGVQQGDHVLIHLPPGCDFVIALWGVVKSGGCYVPIDHHYPQSRVDHIQTDAKARVIINSELLLTALEMPVNNPSVHINDSAPFYTLYTSGSTGKPKGATVTHANENHLSRWYRDTYDFGLDTNVLVISSMGFDLTQKNLIAPLCAGSSVLIPTVDAFDPDIILTAIEQRDANVMNCAPSALYTLIEHQRGINVLSNMQTVLLGGEPISANRIAPLVDSRLYQADLINMYGPTECTDITTVRKYSAAELKQAMPDTFSLGEAIDGVEINLIDEAHRPVPAGLIGEIAICGKSVGLGYWQQMELTQNAFFEKEGKRYYLTGDLAYRDHHKEGQPLIYIGRKDFQVKLKGRRIELNEIQHAVNQLPDVQDSRVLVLNEELIAFVLCSDAINQAQSAWKSQLATELPAFMIPRRLHTLTHFPLNANGKVDQQQLRQMDFQSPVSIEAEPSTDTEITLSELWQEVLGTPVAVNENFFSAGGDSLTAIRLIAKIELHFEIKLPVASLFNAQTIEEQAQLIEQEQQGFSPIVCINKGAEGITPIFAFHALGGMVLSYQPLANAMGKDQPFYGIQAYGFEDNQTPFTNLDNMVDFYLEAIEAQHDGDFKLIGHSVGGLIALEAARKLIAKGKKVTYLGLIDTHPPVGYLGMAVDDAFILKTFVEHNFGKVDLPLSKLRLLPKEKMIQKVVEGLNGLVNASFIERAIAVIRGFQQQMTGFKLKPLDVPLELFRAQEAMESFSGKLKGRLLKDKAHTLGFHKISHDFQLTQVPGDHYTMLSEYAETLAQGIKRFDV